MSSASHRPKKLLCRSLLTVLVVLYAAALFLFAVGTFGLFGNERDPLAGIFLLPLGLPWNQMISFAPELLKPWLAGMAPVLNILIVWLICRGSLMGKITG